VCSLFLELELEAFLSYLVGLALVNSRLATTVVTPYLHESTGQALEKEEEG